MPYLGFRHMFLALLRVRAVKGSAIVAKFVMNCLYQETALKKDLSLSVLGIGYCIIGAIFSVSGL